MSKSKHVAAAIIIEADGIKFHAWSEPNGEVHLQVDDNEEVCLSPATAKCLGIFLAELAKSEESE